MFRAVVVFVCVALFGSWPSFATVTVAFLRTYDTQGRMIELTPGGQGFSHVAIAYKGRWLHAHPYGGVQLSDDLSQFGEVDEILTYVHGHEPSESEVIAYLGKHYDSFFSWGDDRYYCSELVGLLLGVEPQEMQFNGNYWQDYFRRAGRVIHPVGLGISPDNLYNTLIHRGYINNHCVEGLTIGRRQKRRHRQG